MPSETNSEVAGKSRRRYKRVFYSAADQMIGFFLLSGKDQEMLTAHIMNVSIGGLHFTMKRDEMISLKQGDRLVLTKIMGNSPLQIASDIELEIKWVLDHQMMKHIGFGCEFRNLSKEIRSQISQFIESGWGGNALM